MTDDPTSDRIENCAVDPETVLGTRTYEDVLFTDATETPVNALTDETPIRSQATVADAKGFAAEIEDEMPYIAVPLSVEAQVETGSPPYTAAVFFHFNVVGSLERHRAYHAVWESDAFAVDFEADYETGDLTITVERR